MVLNTSPDYSTSPSATDLRRGMEGETLTAWSVERTGSGSVVIWMVLPTILEITNMPIPTCHRRRL